MEILKAYTNKNCGKLKEMNKFNDLVNWQSISIVFHF